MKYMFANVPKVAKKWAKKYGTKISGKKKVTVKRKKK